MEIAIIAHDGKKSEMVNFLTEYKNFFLQDHIKLIATGTTGNKVEGAGFKVKRYLSGPIGGDAQIAGRVAEEKCKMVLFFRDPLEKHPHEPDVLMLLRICDVHNVPLASNPASAKLLIKGVSKLNHEN
ncbi:methylglyoxal synthase [Mesonia aestuariivivens]|uniref:Methylglyoxal synthase n=1 Tax=Mesonia aestuariivivens TaxID=2796128 RepID=A0ABS6VYJ5_9FLAO|nr:methylglyoxal synthase [Mesonia aestuariivivens]MBW2960660.1 methylglyoxal synthase [Mesonia aestuariivivens]